MKSFEGFDDWIEIFRGGKQVDSAGREHDGNTLIDRAIAGFDPKTHEPPICVGHPKENAPAFGWVEGLKEIAGNGAKVLLAKCRQVVPEFESMVKQGLFKKRSASFYPDGRLRHVGFLGAAPPAVKGLADLKFGDDDAIAFEFTGPEPACAEHAGKTGQDKEEKMTFKEFLEVFKFWNQVKDNPDITLPDPAKTQAATGKTFSEADLETAKKEAAAAERKKVEAETAEKSRVAAREARGREIAAFCEESIKAGKIVPAWVKAGIKQFMEGLNAEGAVEFSEGKKQTPLEWFKQFLADLPKFVEFREIAKRGEDAGAKAADAQLIDLAHKKAKEDKISFSEAFSAVCKEHPDLYKEYEKK